MIEIWTQAILPYNLPLTILLGFVSLFWLLTAFGAVDLDSLDIDFDADIDSDIDAGSASPSGDFLVGLLKIVNATDVPLMMVLSMLNLFMWAIAILSNLALNSDQSYLIAAGLLIGNFIISCILVKIITQPLLPFFRSFKKGENDDEPVIGRIGIVKSQEIDGKYGQVEIPRNNGAPAIVNSRMAEGHEPCKRGDKVLIFDKDQEKSLFIARAASPDESI